MGESEARTWYAGILSLLKSRKVVLFLIGILVKILEAKLGIDPVTGWTIVGSCALCAGYITVEDYAQKRSEASK